MGTLFKIVEMDKRSTGEPKRKLYELTEIDWHCTELRSIYFNERDGVSSWPN